jgi:hypothetical protein
VFRDFGTLDNGSAFGFGGTTGLGFTPDFLPFGAFSGGVWPGAYPYGNQFRNPQADLVDSYADMVRARGEARRNWTQGMQNYEDARRRYIENVDRWNDVFLDRLRTQRQINAMRDDAQHEWQQETIAAYRRAQEVVHPEPLTSAELNRETGEITWPEALQDARFEEERQQLAELFSMRARGSDTGEVSRRISILVRLLELKLKNEIGEIPREEYAAASRFLDGLRSDAWLASR